MALFTVIFLGIVAMLCLAGFLGKKFIRKESKPPLTMARAKQLSEKLSRHAVGLVTGKYCALTCNQVLEVENYFLEDLWKIFYDVLRTEFDDAENLASVLARPVKDHLFRMLDTKDCEHCEVRAESLIAGTKDIILMVLSVEYTVTDS